MCYLNVRYAGHLLTLSTFGSSRMVDFTSSSFRDDGDCPSCGAAGLRDTGGAELRCAPGGCGLTSLGGGHVARGETRAVFAGELRINADEVRRASRRSFFQAFPLPIWIRHCLLLDKPSRASITIYSYFYHQSSCPLHVSPRRRTHLALTRMVPGPRPSR